MKVSYPVVLIPFVENKGYTIIFPDLPGCVSEGNSMYEALEMGIDAATGWIVDELECGKSAPLPSNIETVKANAPKDSICKTISFDIATT